MDEQNTRISFQHLPIFLRSAAYETLSGKSRPPWFLGFIKKKNKKKNPCQTGHSLPGPPPGVDTSLRAAKWSYFSARLNTPTSQPNLAPIYGTVLANTRRSEAKQNR